MNRKTWTIFLLGLAAMVLLAQYALTQGCTPGYSAGSMTMGDIQSQAVTPPDPSTRTDVGIGEAVSCWIDSSTFSATATYTDQYCNQSTAEDGLGSVTWTVSGQASVSPSVTYDFSSVTVTFDLADADNVVTVYATATDALAVDPPVQKQKAFNAKIPTGIQVLTATDNPATQLWKQGNANLGAADAFLLQVLPNTVNFSNVSIDVQWSGVKGGKWPNGDPLNVPAVPSGNFVLALQSIGGTPNLASNSWWAGLFPVAKISGQDFDFTNAGNAQYQDQAGVWKGFCSCSFSVKFKGATNQTSVGVIANNTLYGGWQGPWQ